MNKVVSLFVSVGTRRLHWLVGGNFFVGEAAEDATNSAKLVTVQLITVAVFSYARHGIIPLHYVVYVYRY